MFHIENDTLQVAVDSKGAELKSVVHKGINLQYMWQADPAVWAKTSPVLFPIVGALKNDTYFYKGQSYTLPRHGFAREKEFHVAAQQNDSITFLLESDAETLAVYPFLFAFSITYALDNDALTVTYRVENRGEATMLFSIGGHPAFNVPLVEGTAYDDYSLVFEKAETTGRWPVSKDGLIGKVPQPLLNNTAVVSLTKALFRDDALVLKHLNSQSVKIASYKTAHGLQFSFSGFPYLGVWAAPGADFVCIEPWCGIADAVDTDQQLEHKEGILKLDPAHVFEVHWRVRFY